MRAVKPHSFNPKKEIGVRTALHVRGREAGGSKDKAVSARDTSSESEGTQLSCGWKVSTLGRVAKLQTGGTPSRRRPEYWRNGDIPWVKTSEIDYQVIESTEEKITLEGLRNSAAKIFPRGTLLVAMYGQGITRGRVGILGIDAATNQACAAITPDGEKDLVTPFVYYFLQYHYESLRQMGHGANQRNLNMALLRGFPISYPSVTEQRKISAILALAQRAIEQQQQLIALTSELKNALVNKLFTEGLSSQAQKQTEIGPVPENWEVVPLRDCCVVQTGIAKGRKVEPLEALTLPYLRVANVQAGFLDLSEIKKITIRVDEKERYLLRKGDVVLTEGGDFDKLGRGFIWQGQIENCVHQNHIFAVRVDTSRLKPEFFAHLSQSPYGKSYFFSVAHKTTNLACINTTKLKGFPILIPTMTEQERIVSALDSVDARLLHHTRKKTVLEELFRTLLHQLMTAQIRVHDLDLNNLDLNSSDQREEVIATTGR